MAWGDFVTVLNHVFVLRDELAIVLHVAFRQQVAQDVWLPYWRSPQEAQSICRLSAKMIACDIVADK
jgi:hypothetical protein